MLVVTTYNGLTLFDQVNLCSLLVTANKVLDFFLTSPLCSVLVTENDTNFSSVQKVLTLRFILKHCLSVLEH